MMGYWNNPSATSQAIRDGWIYTGDMARKLSDGYFTLVDRRDFLIISGGEKITPAEVEAVIASHPAVREAAVIGLPDPDFGQQVCAFVALRPDAALDLAGLRTFCGQHVARYKLPKKLIVVDALPRTGIGKVAKSQLLALARDSA
jgi:acyl-CoA synthetase (AMP-forming)/AMP-acid ligase II